MTIKAAPTTRPSQLLFDWTTCSVPRLEAADIGPDAVLPPLPPLPLPHESESPDELCCAWDDAHWSGYDPGHPWHYCSRGDGAAPIPFDLIPARVITMQDWYLKWPGLPAKRKAMMRQMLTEQRQGLVEDERRYQRLVDDGVDALSRYDREIAHGGDDELAWASAVALKYNHITLGRGKVQWLSQQLGIRDVEKATAVPRLLSSSDGQQFLDPSGPLSDCAHGDSEE